MASLRWLFNFSSALLALSAGCAVSTGNTQVVRDAGHDTGMRNDSGIAQPDAGDAAAVDDAGTDAAEVDAGTLDAGPPDANLSDAGQDAGRDAAVITPPVVDGVVGDVEWAAAARGSSTTATIWTGNELRRLRAIAIGGTLYLAVEGQIESNNGIVVYVDGDPGGTHGVADLASLTDSMGALDNAISAGFTTPSGFRADVAWGTTVMSHLVSGADDTTGFRDVTAIADFAWITPAQTACTAAACEASVATATLGPGPAPRTIHVFARIVSPDGTMSPNQTLPMDVAAAPRVVSTVLVLHE
jgi:hypothetical protein